jgi:hypothetical protein
VTTLVRQDACIGDDVYIEAKKIEIKKKKRGTILKKKNVIEPATSCL